jgi:hypothetical protein
MGRWKSDDDNDQVNFNPCLLLLFALFNKWCFLILFGKGKMTNMFSKADIRLEKCLKHWSVYFVIFVLVISAMVLAGWTKYEYVNRFVHEMLASNPTVAICFALFAISFLLLDPSATPSKKFPLGKSLAFLAMIAGLLKITQILFHLDYKIGSLIFPWKIRSGGSGQSNIEMSISSSCFFVLLSISLLVQASSRYLNQIVSQGLPILVAFAALFALIASLYSVHSFYGYYSYAPRAFPGSFCFTLLSLSLLLAYPDRGMLRRFGGQLDGSINLRTMLPVAIFGPVLLGLLRLFGYWAGLLNKRDEEIFSMEKTLLKSEARLRLLITSVKDYAIDMIDPEG